MKSLSHDERLFIDEVAKYVGQNKRGKSIVPRVHKLLGAVTQSARKERVAQVSTVVALTASEKTLVKKFLSRILAHDVECQFAIDAELLGGMRVTVADWVVDTSLTSQLTQLSQKLI